MTGEFSTRYEFEDYLRANRIVLLRSWLRPSNLAIFLIVYFGIVCLNYPFDKGLDPVAVRVAAGEALTYLLIAAALVLIFWKWSLPRMARKKWNERDLEGQVANYHITPSGFHVTSPFVTRDYSWPEFAWWTEDTKLLFLKADGCSIIWLPKKQLDPSQLAIFRGELDRAHVRRV